MNVSLVDPANNANRRIDEELVSIDSLKHVLCARCGCKEVLLYREQHDPPDFRVIVDGVSFPSEVTSIVSNQQYSAHCEEFAKAIRDRADSLGVLSGEYAFVVARLPRIPKPTSENGRQLLDAAVAYVDATRQQADSPEAPLARDNSGRIGIAKLAANGSAVDVVWSAPAMWEDEIQSQLAVLIQQAVDDKKLKLQDAGVAPRTALLLLYDAFGYAQPTDAVAAMHLVNAYDWFHSVFWVASFSDRRNTTYPEEPGRDGFFLFSHNPGWNRVGTVPLDIGA